MQISRAGKNAELTVAALREIDIELGDPQHFLFAVTRFTKIFTRYRFYCFDLDATHRAGPGALIATDTVIHVYIEAVSCSFRKNWFFFRILDGHGLIEHIFPCDLHSHQGGDHCSSYFV